jgi:SAM-dependent methyltransferase
MPGDYQDNLQEWMGSVNEMVAEPRIARYLEVLDMQARKRLGSLPESERTGLNEEDVLDHRKDMLRLAEKLLPYQDESMRDYSEDWVKISQRHIETGLYKRILDFFQPDEGLLVDLGCGTGSLLAELPFDSVLGVDINHYCLQMAEEQLAKRGKPVYRFSRSYISFDPEKGFILKPHPLMEELDLSRTNLIIDDISQLDNTVRVLYNQGIKADMVTYMLHGGYTSVSPLQFIDLMRFRDYSDFWQTRRIDYMIDFENAVLDSMGQICRSGGRVLFGRRMSVHDRSGRQLTDAHERMGQELAKRHSDVLDVVRTTTVPIIEEDGISGIVLSRKPIDMSGRDVETDMPDLKDAKTELYLFDIRIR